MLGAHIPQTNCAESLLRQLGRPEHRLGAAGTVVSWSCRNHAQGHQGQALNGKGRCVKEPGTGAGPPLPCPRRQQSMCGPEGHAERQRDDSGVDGPRALDGHLGRNKGMPFRLLADGPTAATTTTRLSLRWLPVSCTPDGFPIPYAEETPLNTRTNTGETQSCTHS